MKNVIYLFGLIVAISLCVACGDDEVVPNPGCADMNVSYSMDIVPIINNACALAGCHVMGFDQGDYSSYAGLKANADDGSLRTQVVATMAMPLENINGPSELTAEEIELFDCWIEAGAPNN